MSSRPAWGAQQNPVSKQQKLKQQTNEFNYHKTFQKSHIGNTQENLNYWVTTEITCSYSPRKRSTGRRKHLRPWASWTATCVWLNDQGAWEPKEVLGWSCPWPSNTVCLCDIVFMTLVPSVWFKMVGWRETVDPSFLTYKYLFCPVELWHLSLQFYFSSAVDGTQGLMCTWHTIY